MTKYTTYVGIDVHARSCSCRSLCLQTGETHSVKFSGDSMAFDLLDWLFSLDGAVYCAYESGCTGYELARRLRQAGFDCDVIAVSTLARSSKDRRNKCDKTDAEAILREIVNPARNYSCVWVPDDEVEAARELARERWHAAEEVKSSKIRIAAFLLRHGIVWQARREDGTIRRAWTVEHRKWLDKLTFPTELSKRTLERMVAALNRREDEEKALRNIIFEESEKPRWKPYVDALMRLKGVGLQTAFLAAAEFGTFSRFNAGRKVSCWLGLTPSESSSGSHDGHGPITKHGNTTLRRALVEGASQMGNRRMGGKDKAKGRFASPEVEAMAERANVRLRERYLHLIEESKLPVNKAKVAIASEQARWIWAVGCQVEREIGSALG